jgi:outer membrane receptor protein involved in Fe transport
LRAAYSRTLARPDLRELSPMYFQDFRSGYARTGNPDLGRTLIDSYDLRLEHFPGIVEVFAASAFYKRFQDPIEMTLIGGQQPLYMPMNGSGGWLYGSELEARFALGRLSAKLGNFGLNTNLTFAKSETKLDKLGVQTTTKRPLEGQPNHVGNVGLFYTSGGGRTSAALLYNVTGEKLSYVGAFGLPDIYEQPRHTLDFKVGLAGGRVKLAIENLLDTEARFEQDGFVTHRSKKGRSASISVSYGA